MFSTNEMPKIGPIRIMNRRLLFFPGRFSTCNRVFRGFQTIEIFLKKHFELSSLIIEISFLHF